LLDDGRTTVRLRCRHASRVELAADFTDWAPIAMTATGDDWWETSLTITPGLHQVQVRLDGGAWQVPPGLPRTSREFAGDAGVLVVN
jgi:1,4-alpha-glucan branching enzyme